MPVYEYKCKSCGKVSDILAEFSKKPTKLKCGCGKFAVPMISVSLIKMGIGKHNFASHRKHKRVVA